LTLIERIKNSIKLRKVEYWSDPGKGNYARSEFDAAIANSPSLSEIKKSPRDSNKRKHGHDGENDVYEAKLTSKGFGMTKEFYLKWFFWKKGDEHDEQGIEVQSFKAWR
jgi:hypothetical protein